jgi:hypothetical protein
MNQHMRRILLDILEVPSPELDKLIFMSIIARTVTTIINLVFSYVLFAKDD